MFVRVDEKQVYWGDRTRTIWITSANREPTEIDMDSINQDVRSSVNQALSCGVLIQTDKLGKPIAKNKINSSPFAGKQDILANKQTFEERTEQGELGVDIETYQKAKGFVKNGLSTIRREVGELKNIQLIRVCIDLEKKTKLRKTVLALLEGQLVKIKGLNNPANMNFYESIIEDIDEKVIVLNSDEGEEHGNSSNS